MKSEVYSWRLSGAKKQSLEDDARRCNLTLAELLERATDAWLEARASGRADDQELQERVRSVASRWVGAIEGGDPSRSARARELVRARLTKPRDR